MKECNTEFQHVGNKICKYFLNGGCIKGDMCIYKHPHNKKFRAAPACRNGPQCRYLSSGVCSFYHRGFVVLRPISQEQQNNGYKQQLSQLCKFIEDCNRFYCHYAQYEEDFPKLRKTNNAPMGNMSQGWEEY